MISLGCRPCLCLTGCIATISRRSGADTSCTSDDLLDHIGTCHNKLIWPSESMSGEKVDLGYLQ